MLHSVSKRPVVIITCMVALALLFASLHFRVASPPAPSRSEARRPVRSSNPAPRSSPRPHPATILVSVQSSPRAPAVEATCRPALLTTSNDSSATLDYAPAVSLDAPRAVCLLHMKAPTRAVAPAPTRLPCGAPCRSPRMTAGPPMAIQVFGGLANRLYEIVSYVAIARRDSRALDIVWSRDAECPARFSDLFMPLRAPDVRIVADQSHALTRVVPLFGNRPHPEFDLRQYGPLALHLLAPLKQHTAAIRALLTRLGPAFLAAHMRRTDLPDTGGMAGAVLDAAVAAWACNDSRRLFVATDNPQSLDVVEQALPRGQVVSQLRAFGAEQRGALRKTSVVAALIDLWVASHAERFVGTPGSTFSTTVEALRVARGLQPGSRSRAPPGTPLPAHLPPSWRYPVAASLAQRPPQQQRRTDSPPEC